MERQHGDIDSFTKYLVLAGYGDAVVASGLEHFVQGWEDTVAWYDRTQKTFGLSLEEFGLDVRCRTVLYEVLQKAPSDSVAKLQERIARTDSHFMEVTVETATPFDYIPNPDKNTHWWLFRIPLDGLR